MKKVLSILALAIFANSAELEGEKIFDKVCSACHHKELSLSQTKELITKGTIKAPPMIEVANRLKSNIEIVDEDDDVHKAVVVAFIKDYIFNPRLEKTMCKPVSVEKFGVMPSQKEKLNIDEAGAVASWIYDYYEGKSFK